MTKKTLYPFTLVIGLITAWSLTGCSTAHAPEENRYSTPLNNELQAQIIPLVEKLYLNTRELKETYHDLRSISRGYAFRRDDEQLNYVQKAALYIQKSYQSALHQWELFSLLEDIRPSASIDYFTARHKSLAQAIDASVDDEQFIVLYQSYITHPAPQSDISAALKRIVANRKLFNHLMTAIAPLVRTKQ